jgi:glucosamine--fructose-6-phosphate aminotransferase (isomerizing)
LTIHSLRVMIFFMCGIVAYSGKNESVLPTLVSGLKRLEYRGYDSAGLAVFANNTIYTKKSVGKIVALQSAVDKNPPLAIGSIGIAHTRWATHGPATTENAHPHASSDKKIWVVHNGIIENYHELKEDFEKRGVHFESETDTEIIAKVIESAYTGDLKKAVLAATKILTGAYSICVISEDEPDRLIGVKMSSPLVVGVGTDEVIIASDVSAIVERTKHVIYLEDGELIDINKNTYSIVSFDNKPKVKPVCEIDWDLETATKRALSLKRDFRAATSNHRLNTGTPY